MRILRTWLSLALVAIGSACASEDLATGNLLDSQMVIAGEVTDGRTGAPVPAALIRAIVRVGTCEDLVWTGPREFHTSVSGRFSERLIVPGGIGSRRGCLELSVQPPAATGLSSMTLLVDEVSITPVNVPADTIELGIELN